jgi:hypothetical protein
MSRWALGATKLPFAFMNLQQPARLMVLNIHRQFGFAMNKTARACPP